MINTFKKAQSAIEFVVIIIAALFFITGFFLVIQNNLNEKNKEKEEILMKNIALSIQDEIALAEKSSNGYFREFNVEENILGKSYEIKIINDRINLNSSSISLSYPVLNIQGNIKKGKNIITKQENIVLLNS